MTEQDDENDVILWGKGVMINSNEEWYMRLWYLISNPFRYLFTGKVKF